MGEIRDENGRLQESQKIFAKMSQQGYFPVSIRLKSTVKTPKGIYIVRKAEKMLMNERIRLINNTITMLNCQIHTCINDLGSRIEMEAMEDCHRFINQGREERHCKTLERQKDKLNWLWQKNTGSHTNIQHGRGGYDWSSFTSEDTEVNSSEDTTTTTTTSETTSRQTQTHSRKKWVHNLSKPPLKEAQEKVLSHGPNFAVVTNEPPIGKYVSQIERMCQQLKQGKVEELWGEIKSILKNSQPPKPNVTKELKKDKEKIILTADKGVSMVIMDKEEYIKKSKELLKQPSYKELTTDPTSKYRNRLINLLKSIKAEGGINNITYKRLYPTGAGSPKYFGLPKIHKAGVPLRPIISSRGSATYETAKELAKILKPLVGRSPHHVQNNKDFLDSIKNIKIKPDECIMSYDVSALFTSIPIEPAINIIKKRLEEDKELNNRTSMTVKHTSCLLEFCLKNTYFSFQGRFYEQTEGAAMESPISPIVANLFMEDQEAQAIKTSTTPPALWKRFVDDTFTIIKKDNRNSFLQHLNSIHPNIKFTCEEVRSGGSMPFPSLTS